ncbi:uncharacterized protein LOC123546272 [Mercenaria mercenaria]|uniref:uncharacterized protein LOC123546272 n=1 Tax=Mercenaria mercenaria TaxID=6596 RepID=UPI00234EEFFD|nr:uncharacterized protein LOC123546272 [Mercenaria mercenaria]
MPRFKAVKTLKRCCYRRIALSFDKYWMKDIDKTFYELPRLLYILGPFENLTSEMIQSLLDALVQEKCLKRQHFMVLIQQNLTQLDLSSAGMAANNDIVVKTITNRCPKLMSLSLHGLSNISARALADLTTQLTDLRTLDLVQTNCNDQVLSVIGHNCLELSQLLISQTKVTNSGAYSLCQAFCADKGCKKLKKLSIFTTMINADGALHCLKNLPSLQYFGFDDVCGVIELDVNEKTNKGEELRPYELRNIVLHGIRLFHVTEESVVLSCRWCPKAMEARLYYKVCDDNILAVKQLKHLTRLGIGNNDGLTFENGVLPVLKEIGHQLLDLTLADVNDFDLLAVGYWGRNLQKLTVLLSEENEMNLPTNLSGVPVDGRGLLFTKLSSLEVAYPMIDTVIQKSAFIVLMKNAKELKQLTIQYVTWVTTELFLEILEENPMRKLQELKLVLCDNVDSEVIHNLVHGRNDLTLMKLQKCRNISRQECESLQRYAQKQNMDLEISWS